MKNNNYFFLLSFIFLAIQLSAQSFFVQPQFPFIQKPSEVITDIAFTNGTSIATMQSAINTNRTLYPNNIIRIIISGTFTVTTAPLQITDRMLLILKNATIIAASNATATSLISVSNGHYITIASNGTSLLDGNNMNITGINVNTSGKTHIDNLSIQNCKSGGVLYTGAGAVLYADAGSVTRCTITNCTAFGIYYTDSFNFICTDNIVKSSNTGIYVNSDNSAIANNTVSTCNTGIYISAKYDAVTYNTIDNCTTGVSIFNSTSEALFSHNTLKNNGTACGLTCGNARIYYNTFLNNTVEISGSGANTTQLFCNIGLTSAEATGVGCTYFNPPLIGNQHNDIIKTGKPRMDITLTSGSMSSIRTALNNAHTASPTAVVVCHLNGNFFTSSTTDSLLVKDNECILLNGTIANGSGQTNAVIYFKDSNIISSFSGGTIDGENLNGTNALVYITGSTNVVLDAITVKNSVGQGITKRSSSSPTYIRGCTVDSCGARNIWALVASRLYAFSNTTTHSRYDGIDFDAFSTNSVAMKNTLNYNTRDGVFIEEGANGHIIMNNTANYNTAPGIAFYNMAVANLHTSKCLIANNTCNYNSRGVHLNALSTDRSTSDNMIFNNVCNNNTDVGFGGLYKSTTTTNNYYAFNSAQNNRNGIFASPRDYTVNTDWNLIFPKDITTNASVHAVSFSAKLSSNILSSSTLRFQINGSDSAVDIAFMDLNGKILCTKKVENGNNSLEVGNITQGMYILQLRNNLSTITLKTLKL